MSTPDRSFKTFVDRHLIGLIIAGICLGIVLAALSPDLARKAGLLGDLFVQALKAVAPVLILVLVIAALTNRQSTHKSRMRPVLMLYLAGTLSAAVVAVLLSFAFPSTLLLDVDAATANAPQGIGEVLKNLLLKLVDNPINALLTGNFIGILVWGVALGLALNRANEATRNAIQDLSDAVTSIVRWVIRFAPIGIFGLVATSLADAGVSALLSYAHVLGVLLSAMAIMALLINPLLFWLWSRRNPYPVVFRALRESGITAFFTRSSAANVPVNLALCERLNLEKDTYAVSIPLGATINMGGAAITISVLTLAAVHTLDIPADFSTALLLSVVAAVSACGASGVAGGSLLLIPLSCGLFGISDDIAMQVVATGFIISILQDSAETALNSSTDVVFTAAVSARS